MASEKSSVRPDRPDLSILFRSLSIKRPVTKLIELTSASLRRAQKNVFNQSLVGHFFWNADVNVHF